MASSQYPQSSQQGRGGFQGGQRQGYQGRNDREMQDDRPSFDVNRIEFKKRPEKPDPHLFSDCAEDAARAVADPRGQVNKSTQLRRFYDELVMWQEKVGSDEAKFKDCEPYLRMLKAKAAYAMGRQHVDERFRSMFNRLIDGSQDPETLRQAKLFFEAFLAYYKVYSKQ
jgi:CRISPR-associated protein Csm2